jgi:hypothetical protein
MPAASVRSWSRSQRSGGVWPLAEIPEGGFAGVEFGRTRVIISSGMHRPLRGSRTGIRPRDERCRKRLAPCPRIRRGGCRRARQEARRSAAAKALADSFVQVDLRFHCRCKPSLLIRSTQVARNRYRKVLHPAGGTEADEAGSAEAMAGFRRLGFPRLFFLPLHSLLSRMHCSSPRRSLRSCSEAAETLRARRDGRGGNRRGLAKMVHRERTLFVFLRSGGLPLAH